ncbi:hypothetical protein DPMN_056500 [Dreissena polymorpha]|uniref:Uncharacterized protein n=1 Tax=Dreissena polymorpha TaxID=45954 RepID=A0A9D4HTN5_DREPO|nr:hypothetical protein DPMN_056500 [Dreissena polymorpha]
MLLNRSDDNIWYELNGPVFQWPDSDDMARLSWRMARFDADVLNGTDSAAEFRGSDSEKRASENAD